LVSKTNALHRRELEISNRIHRENLEKMVSEGPAKLHKALEEISKIIESFTTPK
jgi:hypothetical protein